VVIFAGAAGALFFGRHLKQIPKLLSLFDALGLGLFTIIGIQKGIEHGLSEALSVALGTITGCFGGVLRDVFLNKVPLVFQKEIYASASIVGGFVYFFTIYVDISPEVAGLICMLLIFMIRMLSLRFNWQLPHFYHSKPK
jgi:uncharacterized membrane protein YeiH